MSRPFEDLLIESIDPTLEKDVETPWAAEIDA
jgi:hypothetical protein